MSSSHHNPQQDLLQPNQQPQQQTLQTPQLPQTATQVQSPLQDPSALQNQSTQPSQSQAQSQAQTCQAESSSSQPSQPCQQEKQGQQDGEEEQWPVGPYTFPTFRLRTQEHPEKKPLVLVVCGSFSPITIMHLRMCEMASDWVRMVEDNYEVIGIYLSPVSDAYKKANLAEARHRVRMCELAVEDTTNCVMVDPWEAQQPRYVPTAQVLDHFRNEIQGVVGQTVRVALLCGADLMHSMSTPGIWSPDDLDQILGDGGLYVVERHGTDLDDAKEALGKWKDNISVIPQGVPIDLSSTKVRLFLHKKMSVRYFVPNQVIQYIYDHGLYGTGKDATDAGTHPDVGRKTTGANVFEPR